MLSYLAYGLGIHSELPIPEFTQAEINGDILICLDSHRRVADVVPAAVAQKTIAVQLDRNESIIYQRDVGVCVVHNGCKIIVSPNQDATDQQISSLLTGMAMPILLYQRGALILHGSAVSIEGHAVVFLGHSGEGKSSMAAALHARGHPLLVDDVVAVTLTVNQALLCPGFSQVKLTPELADMLGYDRDRLYFLDIPSAKQAYRPQQRLDRGPLTIQRIYVLASGPEVNVYPLKPYEAVIAHLQYAGLTGVLPARDKRHFLQCAALARACPTYKLQRPRDLTFLPKLARLVEESVIDDIHRSTSVHIRLAS